MPTFNFFVRNIVIQRRLNADYIHHMTEEGEKQTNFIAYGDDSPAKKAQEMANVAQHEKWGGEESKAFFAALKTFMAMGHNTDYVYSVDEENNVHIIAK